MIKYGCMVHALAHHLGIDVSEIVSTLAERPDKVLPNGEARGTHICELIDYAFRYHDRTMLYVCNHATIAGQHVEHNIPFHEYQKSFSGVMFTYKHALAWDSKTKMYWCINRGDLVIPESEILCGIFDVTI